MENCEHFEEIIRRNYVKLRRELDVAIIVDYFFQNKLLELHDMEEIKSIQLPMDKADKFLVRCLKMNKAKAYDTFTKALKDLNQDHILKLFEEYRKSSSISDAVLPGELHDATTQTETTETCRKDTEAQTDLSCSSDDPTLSPSICLNCGRHSFYNSTYGYEDATSLQRAPKLQSESVQVAEDEHGYTLLVPRDQTMHEQDTGGEFQSVTFRNIKEPKTTTDAAARDRTGLVYLTKAMSEPTYDSPVFKDLNHPDLAALKEDVMKLVGWRPDVNESNVKDKAQTCEGQQGCYFIWWHRRSKRDSLTPSSRSSVSRYGRFIVSVWSKKALLHYKVLDKKDENQQRIYYVDKSFSSPSISTLIKTWIVKGVSAKEDRL